MGARRHSLAKRLAGASLGRLLSVDQAAQILGVDRNAIREWMSRHPAEDDWQAVSELSGALLVERLARGQIQAPRDLAVLKGISDRNIRYRDLIRGRQERDPGNVDHRPHGAAIDALREDQRTLASETLRLEVARRQATDVPEPTAPLSEDEADAQLAAWLAATAALSEEEVTRQRAEVAAEAAAIVHVRLIEPDTSAALRSDLAVPVAPPAEPMPAEPSPSTVVLHDGTWHRLRTFDP